MKAAVIVFPGSNCDRDIARALERQDGCKAEMVWHGEGLPKADLVVLPGGFSYGDYLRAGAMAAHSPVMKDVVRRGREGGAILGICNGFQILAECGLLEGALTRNRNLSFLCRSVPLRVERRMKPFTDGLAEGEKVMMEIAHMEGRYQADEETLDRLEGEGRVVFRYSGEENPNGSARGIAGIVNEGGNVLGMMPHPERGGGGERMLRSLAMSFS